MLQEQISMLMNMLQENDTVDEGEEVEQHGQSQ